MISTFPPTRCGVAEYTKALVDELRKNATVIVLSDRNCWRRGSFRIAFDVLAGTLREKPDIVHLQFEYLLFGKGEFALLLLLPFLLFRLLSLRVVVTMHSVIPLEILSRSFFEEHTHSGRFLTLKRLAVFLFTFLLCHFCVDAIIVHDSRSRQILISEYHLPYRNVVVIPHFVYRKRETPPADVCKSKLGFEGKTVIVQFGFVKPAKGIELAIKAIGILKERNVVLVVIGGLPLQTHPNPDAARYYERFVKHTREKGLPVVWTGFLPDQILPTYLNAADIFIFPCRDEAAGASGALNMVIPYGKKIIASRIAKFQSLPLVFFEPSDHRDLAEKLGETIKQASTTTYKGYELSQAALRHMSVYSNP